MVDIVRGPIEFSSLSSAIPVIFDEVFVGLYRIGMKGAGAVLGVYPDISVNAKILTGGIVPMAVTMASDSIFQAFMSENKADALLHGHSYTAHPVGCEVANKTLDIVEKLVQSGPWKDAQERWLTTGRGGDETGIWSLWDPTFVHDMSCMPIVDETMTMGTVLAIKFKDEQAGKHSVYPLLAVFD